MSTRHVEARILDRGVHVEHSPINRWVVTDSPPLEEALHHRQRPVWLSGRMAETDSKGKRPWDSLYGAVDKPGPPMDFLRTEHRDTEAALREASDPPA